MSIFIILLSILQVIHGQDPPVPGSGDIAPTVHQVLILDPIPIQNIYGREELRLECSASGNPAPLIEWSFNGVKFVKDAPFNNVEGAEIRHTITGNRISIRHVKGKTDGDNNYYDSGRYRCIASNTVGSVFLEKNIQIRVMGIFRPGSRAKDSTKKHNPTIGRKFIIECPPHSRGYGTTFRWGLVPRSTNIPEYWLPGERNPKIFFTREGEIVWSVISQDDITQSRDVGGLQCILTNFGLFEASNQQVLWQSYESVREFRKPTLVAKLDKTMLAPVNTEFSLICGATGNPVPKYRWQYQGVNIVGRRNNSDELNFEFFQFLGNKMQLRIRRITKYSGGTFRCIAENDKGIVWSIGQLSVAFPPKWIEKFPESIDVAFGNTFELICNATGFPQPVFEWFQNSTKLTTKDKRKIVTGEAKGDIGGILKLTLATYEDNGIYICVASNYLDTLTMSVNLKIQAMKPEFKVPLDDPIYLFRTETMYLKCNPAGGPIPEKKWRKDGVAIEDGGRFKVHPNGTLEIQNVVSDDIGVYTCEATNYLGKAESSGTAIVLDPTVIIAPPRSLSHAVGWGYTVLYCGATWDQRLDLRIEWYKGGVRMAKFTDKVYLEDRAKGPPRLLYIKNLTIYDAGNYSCHAYSRVGNVVSEQEKMAVLRIKGAPMPPAGVSVVGDCSSYNARLEWSRGEELDEETRQFYIEFSTNMSSQANAWFGGQGDPLVPGSEIVVWPGTMVQFQLTKKELVPGANLIFRIRAASQFLVGEPSRPSKINTCITPPGAPVMNPLNVTGITKGTGTLTISWRMVMDVYHGASNFHYEVNYKTAEATAYTTTLIKDHNRTEFEIPTPGIYTKYFFKVRSINDIGPGPEPLEVSAFSGREAPTEEVQNFRVSRISRFTVDLAWDPVAIADGYRVRYYNVTDAEALRGRNRRSTDPVVMQYQYFTGSEFTNGGSLKNLTAQLEFLASIAPFNNGGTGPESPLIYFTTEARVPGPPHNVKLVVYGDSIHISWHPPINPNGYIEQYEISWYESDLTDRKETKVELSQRVTKDRRSREAYLIGIFKPYTYYDIKLTARNRVGPGADWQRERITVSAPDVPGKAQAPKAVPFDDSKINITYQRPNYGGLPNKFYVLYRPTGRYYEAPLNMSQEFPKRAWILITDLEFYVYDFWTVGVNELGQSETSDVTEMQPIRRPKGTQAHASPYPWWRSNWFVAITLCILFILITMIVVIILLRPGPTPYARLKDSKVPEYPPAGKTMAVEIESQPLAAIATVTGAAAVAAAVDYAENEGDDRKYLSTSEEPQSELDNLPPRYSSQSSFEKKARSSEGSSYTGTRSDYSGSETGSETGSESEYSTEDDRSQDDRSYDSDEEKKRYSSEEESDHQDDDELAAFV